MIGNKDMSNNSMNNIRENRRKDDNLFYNFYTKHKNFLIIVATIIFMFFPIYLSRAKILSIYEGAIEGKPSVNQIFHDKYNIGSSCIRNIEEEIEKKLLVSVHAAFKR